MQLDKRATAADLMFAMRLDRLAGLRLTYLSNIAGGSSNAPIHLSAIAKHIGVPLDWDDWDNLGYKLPLLVNCMPAGRYLGEEYFRAGGKKLEETMPLLVYDIC